MKQFLKNSEKKNQLEKNKKIYLQTIKKIHIMDLKIDSGIRKNHISYIMNNLRL